MFFTLLYYEKLSLPLGIGSASFIGNRFSPLVYSANTYLGRRSLFLAMVAPFKPLLLRPTPDDCLLYLPFYPFRAKQSSFYQIISSLIYGRDLFSNAFFSPGYFGKRGNRVCLCKPGSYYPGICSGSSSCPGGSPAYLLLDSYTLFCLSGSLPKSALLLVCGRREFRIRNVDQIPYPSSGPFDFSFPSFFSKEPAAF